MKKRFYILWLLLLSIAIEAYPQSKTISGGNDHGLIICAQGYLYTWGNNFSDVIGGPLLGIDPDVPGNTPDAKVVYSPQRVKTGNLTFSMVTSGSGAFNLALSCHNVVYAWGEDSQHGCGQGANTASAIVKYPVPVLKGETPGYTEDGQPGGDYLGGVTYIAASTNSGFAIMDDGRVVGWGNGSWNPNTGAAAAVPAYIKDKAGNDLQNITHISGGDDNCLLRDADGNLYGIGPWNGSGRNVTTTYAVPVVMEETGEPLKDIRMSAAGDVCGFAVTGDGYVWSWGNGGWGGSTGQSKSGLTHYGALRVCSGEYETISGEEYLTDVKEVIGGRGHGAAVTKEGYLVYWGCNDDNGGVAPATNIPADYKSGAQGVKPILARYCDASGKPGELVKDAVSVSRGDNFDFMVNDKDEFYVWGLNDLGQAGTGDKSVETYNCLIKLETIPCEIQDGCPEVFMIDRLKCPGEMIELDCGFVIPKGKEDRYYVQWFLNDELLNTSKLVLSNQGTPAYDKSYDSDPYNKAAIEITEPGRYKVIVYYVGVNIPCDACDPDSIEIEVTDMNMPIDTIVTTMNCVAEPLKPTSSDNICFEAVVNDKFYNSKQNVTFAAFSTADSKDTLEIIETTGGGGEISFCVTGDKIAASEVHDNSGDLSKDTTYTVWLEDLTSFETYLFKNQKAVDAGSFQSYGILLDLYSDSDLKSFDIFAKGYSGTSEISATPVIYTVAKDDNGKYYPDKVFWTGEAQTFEITSDEPNQLTVECGVRLTGIARGTRYILGMNFKGNCNIYTYDTPASKQNMPDFVTPVEDSEEFGIFAMGATANSYTIEANGADKSCYTNITFGKLTDYDCGRIMLTAQYGCPPCNKPDLNANGKYVEIVPSVEKSADDEMVHLCKGSSVELAVSDVKNTTKTDAAFDILWFENEADFADDDKAIKSDVTGKATESAITVAWDDLTPGEKKTYYVKVRDHEKSDAAACYVFDSVVVMPDTVPVVPEIEIEPFCAGKLDDDGKAEIEKAFDFSALEYSYVIKDASDAEVELSALVGGINEMEAGEHTYSVVVTDDKTSCVSEPAEFTITIYAVPDAPATKVVPLLKEDGASESIASGATATEGNELVWYKDENLTKGSDEAPKQDLSVADTFYYWVSQKSEDGCESDTSRVTVIVNDAPVPAVRDTALCTGMSIADLSGLVTPLDATYTLKWYSSADAEKGTGSDEAPSFSETEPGDYPYFVSQLNTKTNAESEKSEFKVTVYDVAKPETDTKLEYCIGEEAEILKATEVEDGDYIKSSGLEWFAKEPAEGVTGSATASTPATNKAGDVSYWVRQYFKLPNKGGATCYGKPVEIVVTTNETEVPASEKSYTYNYLKTDVKNGKFDDLVTKDPNAIVASDDCELVWFDADKKELSSVPSPSYDPNQAGDDRQEFFYVAQKNNTTGCLSELVKVTVNISDTPAPIVKDINYCEDSKLVAALTAQINESAKPADQYELVWFDGEPNKTPTKDADNILDAAPVPDVKVPNDVKGKGNPMKIVRSYYVAQKDKESGAVSVASKINVTTYAKPMLTTNDASGICYPDSAELADYYDWSADANELVTRYYYADNSQMGSPNVYESGLYHVTGEFEVPSSSEICISKMEDINVTIDKLENVKITASETTCPGTSIELEASSKTNSEDGSDADVKYTWTSTNGDNLEGKKVNSAVMNGKAGDKFMFELTAEFGVNGVCKQTIEHEVTIGDGPIEGNILISEANNKDWNNVKLKATDLANTKVYTCGGELSLSPSMTKTEGDFVWTKDGAEYATGDATVTESGVYTVTYTNKCPTSVDVTVVAVPLKVTPDNTSMLICENESFSASLDIECPEKDKVKIEWLKDGVNTTSVSGSSWSFDPARPEHSGVYSYVVTNRGCEVAGKIAKGDPLTVRPYIKFGVVPEVSGASADEKYEYVLRRDSSLQLAIGFDVPSDGNVENIKWIDKRGNEVSTEPLYNLTVKGDDVYTIKISDSKHCDADTVVKVWMDARLQMTTDLVDDMCYGETKVLEIDTTGIGKFYYPAKSSLTVTEKIKGVESKVQGWDISEGKLKLEVSPADTAVYTVKFEYRNGEGVDAQSIILEETINVLPPIVIKEPTGLAFCGNGEDELEVALTVSPQGTVIKWDNEDGYIVKESSDSYTVTISKEFERGTNHKEAYYVKGVASYDVCEEKPVEVLVTVEEPLKGKVSGDSIICEEASANLSAEAYEADTYVWTAENDFIGEKTGAAINVSPAEGYAYYTVNMTRGNCKAVDYYSVEVSPNPVISSVDSVNYQDVEIVVDPFYGKSPFTMWIDDNVQVSGDPIKTMVGYGVHTAFVRDTIGCMSSVQFEVIPPAINVPIVISPNGDGKNDLFTVPSLSEAYPDAKIKIFDRFGKLLVEYKGSADGWDGTYNGQLMPSTDYWYEIEIKEIGKTYVGHFTLIRQ
ncbi:MAG: T9SS type B sorting domain-containing protein [Paludibacteraceae bacterium]|nr:T9SS type B sorting domain-containing protein [Paludibacteraceae bacterium]